ncbi:GIY-YIG nuclease family protein [Streptomyces sp. H27-G5]|uniref:GIY-YIG nuclease family protein n=1 Tax=Streptomyces sp. H27-G5 TaxID=2996698 RepID=UPI002271EF0B|nr:GIY-YIG nuclease family protein [Streptomyces sp. H27-G5]MCY0923894.1 GIY-YIG nuclease family protein [Streptomyces sp. H27-G5]
MSVRGTAVPAPHGLGHDTVSTRVDGCVGCGHAAHDTVCPVAGWDAWLDCQCGATDGLPVGSVVYLIGSVDSNLTKIGVTSQLAARLRALRASSPVRLEVLWSTAGDRALETALHQRFKDRRAHGEWFDFKGTSPVAAVKEAAAELTDPPAWHVGLPVCTRCGHTAKDHRPAKGACTWEGEFWRACYCSTYAAAAPARAGVLQ